MDEPSSPEGNPITLRIKFKSASLDEFVARYGADVSAGGIFIRTKQPLAVGSLLRFDFSLADGSLLLAGLGTVVWVREPDPSRVGSIPGMGLRFDQLAPESQQMHQQILAVKAGRGDRPTGIAPAPAAPAPRPALRPATPPPVAPRPATPPPVAPRPAPAPPAVAQPARREIADPFDEFSSGGRTEIAAKPPSFYFDSANSVHGAGAGARQEAAPAAALEDTVTDSQTAVAPPDSARSEPIDISEDGSEDDGEEATSIDAMALPRAIAEQERARRVADQPARETFDLPPLNTAEAAPIADLPPSPAPASGATNGRPSSAAVKIPTGQSWLDQAMDMPEAATAAPIEVSPEPTEEVPALPPGAPEEVPVPSLSEAEQAAPRNSEVFEPEIPEEEPRKPAGQGRKLVVVGILAAGLAFAGVYLLQAKPWQSAVAPEPRPTPVTPAPAPVVPPPVPKMPEPSQQPAAQPTLPAPEPEPAKPAVKAGEAKPTETPTKSNPKPVEAVKPETAAEAMKHPAPATGAKKPAGKSALSQMPNSSALAAGQGETVYLLKLRSVPPGAQVIIDGESMGDTPFQRRILDVDKPHTVSIRKPKFESYDHIVTPGDHWEKDGNSEVLKIVVKLRRSKDQGAAPSAEPQPPQQPQPQPEPAPEKL